MSRTTFVARKIERTALYLGSLFLVALALIVAIPGLTAGF